jgi:methyl-accepting chemotaxis protein
MSRVIGLAALGLGAIGLVGCLAGLIGIWAVRPSFLRSSVEVLDTADGGLTLVDEKTTRADELLKAIRKSVDPVTGKIRKLAKGERTSDDEEELKQIVEALARRLGQVDRIAELAETAVAFLNRTPPLTKSLRLRNSQGTAGRAPAETSQDSAKARSRLATALKKIRENLAKFRKDKQVQKEVVKAVVDLAREVDSELKSVESKVERVRQKAAELGTEVADLRTAVPDWTNWAAVIGSVVLVWMGLGQLVLSRWGWDRIRGNAEKRP